MSKLRIFRRTVRRTFLYWHHFLSRSRSLTYLYILTVGAIARLLPECKLRDALQVLVIGQGIRWKQSHFPARAVIAGNSTPIKLRPHLGEFDQAALFRNRLDYEKPIFDWLERNAAERYDAIIEIGANVGVYSVFFDALIKQHPDRRLQCIYSFEPSREAYNRLSDNLIINDTRSVVPFCVAISNRTGFEQFFEPEGHLTNGSLLRDFAGNFSPRVHNNVVASVDASVLYQLIAHHANVLVKVDTEGFEAPILEAMAFVLEKHAPDLLIEVLDGFDAQLRDLPCLSQYAKFIFKPSGPARQEVLKADPSCRDWLFTKFASQIDAPEK